jgi:hypothetical protein
LLLQKPYQQAFGGFGISASLDDLTENEAILVDGAPKSVFSATVGNYNLVQITDIMSRRFLAAQLPGKGGSELSPPSADGFVGNDDAAFQQHFLDHPQAQGKAEIKPDRTKQ